MAFGAGASLALGVLGGFAAAELARSSPRGPAAPERSASWPAGGVIGTHVGRGSTPPPSSGRMVDLAPPRSADLPYAQRSRTWFVTN
ncbi:hypothetical protein QUV83_11980 [Cellulomonas cellasea]|uniref:hypothetical protein n=1 Tax=Cellulomonas cellasea TaxID=43670 RepID=UPI0025A3B4E5|nr:hypothetical protein [Cellulomonas cellasea]MDM8085486.1 hypothetical protein [Cellulomonas cellasea]